MAENFFLHMCSMTSLILCFTFFNFVLVQYAPELPAGDSYGIVATEWAIRDTLNNLFSTLKLKVMQQKLKLKQYSTIHNFFVSITLRDHDNLKKIAKLTQVENIDNGTQVFIAQLNEVLDEDNKSDVATDSIYVKNLIKEFIDRLDNLKETNELQNNTKFDLNKAILRYFSDHENEFGNTTYLKKVHVKGNYSDDNVLDSIESWLPSGRRIFAGTKSNIKRFPFMASVQFFKKFQCGGSIIKSDLIITSGSCLQIAHNNRFFRENPAFLSVQVGSSLYERGGENVPVLEVNFHPNYNPKNLRHNLAIMRLTRKLKFSRKGKKIKKINFDRNPWTLPPNTEGIVIVGWGARAFGTNAVSLWKNELSFSTLDFYPLMECQEIYTKEFVTDRNFCAGFFSKGGGACNHDAGGPGVAGGILVGVISFGAPVCGTPDAPTVFTKLGYYTDWIEEIMETKTLQGSQPTTQRTVSYHKFGLPSFKKTTPFRVTPIVFENPSKDNRFDRLRTNDKKLEFKDFLKTMFKKKKQEQEKEKENVQEQEDEREQEDVQEQEDEQEQEDVQKQEYELETEDVREQEDERKQEYLQEQEDAQEQDDGQKQVDVKEQGDVQEQQVERERKEETEEVQDVKEVDKSKPKPSLRNKSETKPKKDKERKPLISKPKRKLKRKEKNKMTMESHSHSKENSVDETTLQPNTAFEIHKAKVTSLLRYYDAPTTPSFNKRNDGNEKTSSSQENDMDDAIESLIDDLNLNFILESKNSTSKDQQKMRARVELHKDTVLYQYNLNTEVTHTEGPRNLVKNETPNANEEDQSDADDTSYKENSNEQSDSGKFLGDKQTSFNDETIEQNVKDSKNVEIAARSQRAGNAEDKSQSADNVEDHSNDNDKSEHTEEVIHEVSKDDEKIDNDDLDDDGVNDGGETEEEFESLSIPANILDQKHSSNSTEQLLEMMEYEDLYKLLMKDS